MNPIVKFVAKQLFGKKGAIANRKAVDFSVAKLVERLTNFGVDPRSIKDEKQLIQILNSVKKMEDQAFEQQFGDMLKKSKIKKSAEVVDLQGKKIPDPERNIMGGQAFETEDKIAKGLSDKEFRSEKTSFRLNIGKNSPEFNQDLAKRIINREIYTDLSDSQRKQFLDDLDFVLKNPRDGNADGGRIGLKDGMDRRTFMKILGGLATLPILGRYFKGAEKAAPVVEKVAETATQAPTYFFDLVAKIKMFGKKSKSGPSERIDEYSYTGKNGDQYTLTEDITTGDAQITKDKMGIGSSGDKTFDVIEDRTVMEYKSPKKDVDIETQKTIDEAAEYDEYKVEFDQDGTQAGADTIDEMIQKEIIEESKKAAPPIKKASGGLAYMLGE